MFDHLLAKRQARSDEICQSKSFDTCSRTCGKCVNESQCSLIRLSPFERCRVQITKQTNNFHFENNEHEQRRQWKAIRHRQTVHLSTWSHTHWCGRQDGLTTRVIDRVWHQPVRGTASLKTGDHISHCSIGCKPSCDKDAQLAFIVFLEFQCDAVHCPSAVIVWLGSGYLMHGW